MVIQEVRQFRRCHLTVLRSLYGDDCAGKQLSTDDIDTSLSMINSHKTVSEGSKCESASDEADVKVAKDHCDHNVKRKGVAGHDTAGSENCPIEEPPVSNEIWVLIEQFLCQRGEYYPLKDRENHWAQLHSEAKSRLDKLVYLASEAEEKNQLSASKNHHISHTPLLKMMGKRSSTPILSLTPLSSNRSRMQQPNAYANELSSWTFIHRMLERRKTLCTRSREAFCAQPFLQTLMKECEERCKLLDTRLQQLRFRQDEEAAGIGGTSMPYGIDQLEERNVLATVEPPAKRQKLDRGLDRMAIGSGATEIEKGIASSTAGTHYFFRNYFSTDEQPHVLSLSSKSKSANEPDTDDAIISSQIKLCLWSSLLTLLREIVDEKK